MNINSLLLISLIFISCSLIHKKEERFKKKNNFLLQKKESVLIKYDYSNIQTNSYEDNFDGDLINTLPVKKGDTVLFRSWGNNDYKSNVIFLTEKKTKYKIQDSKYLNYYKTGENKFSAFTLFIENTKTKEKYNFHSYVDKKRSINPYNMNNISGNLHLEKESKNKGVLRVFSIHAKKFLIYFKIENGDLKITQMKFYPFKQGAKYWFELDTLININKKNNLVKVSELSTILVNQRNLKR